MEKSVDAFRTISEVADELQLPQHVLRFWETRFSQIRPLKRAGGRRYYRPADVVLLQSIRRLLYDQGYTIKGVQRLLKDKGGKGVPDSPDHPGASQVSVAELLVHPPAQTEPERDRPDGEHSSGEAARNDTAFNRTARAELRELLTIITECERILDALRHPPG